jgi:hypothetical protein
LFGVSWSCINHALSSFQVSSRAADFDPTFKQLIDDMSPNKATSSGHQSISSWSVNRFHSAKRLLITHEISGIIQWVKH